MFPPKKYHTWAKIKQISYQFNTTPGLDHFHRYLIITYLYHKYQYTLLRSNIYSNLCYRLGQKCVYETLNPKAVRNDELYGWLSGSDWNDGIISAIMRNMSRWGGEIKKEKPST